VSGQDLKDRVHALYNRCYKSVVERFVRKGWDRETARELAQDVFVRVYPHVDDIHFAAEWTYLGAAVESVHKNALRTLEAKGRNVPKVSLDVPIDGGDRPPDYADAGAPSPEDAAIKSAELKLLRDAILRLPAAIRQALELDLQDLSNREVAAALRISEGAVKTRLRDARRLLRQDLAPAGIEVAWPPAIAEDADDDREE
jgi:RNA polymerase sigma factor (sigma-70 family)